MGVQIVAPQSGETKDDFDTGVFACLNDLSKPAPCLYATFCLPIRTAHTYAAAGLVSYWFYLLAYLLLSMIPFGSCCVIGALRTWFRVQLKQKMGITPHYATDILLSTCCCWFTAAQEAKAVDSALEVDVECCFQLKRRGGDGECGSDKQAPQAHTMGNITRDGSQEVV